MTRNDTADGYATPNKIVGLNVQRFRSLRGYTQSRMAQELSGMTDQHWSIAKVSETETARRRTTSDDLVALAYVLGVTVAELFIPQDGATAALADSPLSDFGAHVLPLPGEYFDRTMLAELRSRAKLDSLLQYVRHQIAIESSEFRKAVLTDLEVSTRAYAGDQEAITELAMYEEESDG